MENEAKEGNIAGLKSKLSMAEIKSGKQAKRIEDVENKLKQKNSEIKRLQEELAKFQSGTTLGSAKSESLSEKVPTTILDKRKQRDEETKVIEWSGNEETKVIKRLAIRR